MANSAGAALGPVLGGALIALAGWPALFWVNVPMGLLATGAALAWVPADGEAQRRPARQLVTDSDLPGITLFAAAATSGVLLVLSLPTRPRWLLAPLAVCGLFGFILREHRCKKPFVNLRMLRSNHALLMVYVQFLAFNVAYYAAFYGLPPMARERAQHTARAHRAAHTADRSTRSTRHVSRVAPHPPH